MAKGDTRIKFTLHHIHLYSRRICKLNEFFSIAMSKETMPSNNCSANGCRFTGKEPSPKGLGRCAHLEMLGAIARGKDGSVWIVTADKNGRRSWRRHSGTSYSCPNPSMTIRIGEVYTGGFMNDYVELRVSETFLKVLMKRPKVVRRARESQNAYVFGRLFNKNTYKYAGHHGNDGAQTGIVAMNPYVDGRKITGNPTWRYISGNPTWRAVIDTMKSWDQPKVLKRVRKDISSHILFIGDTDGGDVGANVYVHVDAWGEIDSIIIDNDYYFC